MLVLLWLVLGVSALGLLLKFNAPLVLHGLCGLVFPGFAATEILLGLGVAQARALPYQSGRTLRAPFPARKRRAPQYTGAGIGLRNFFDCPSILIEGEDQRRMLGRNVLVPQRRGVGSFRPFQPPGYSSRSPRLRTY